VSQRPSRACLRVCVESLAYSPADVIGGAGQTGAPNPYSGCGDVAAGGSYRPAGRSSDGGRSVPAAQYGHLSWVPPGGRHPDVGCMLQKATFPNNLNASRAKGPPDQPGGGPSDRSCDRNEQHRASLGYHPANAACPRCAIRPYLLLAGASTLSPAAEDEGLRTRCARAPSQGHERSTAVPHVTCRRVPAGQLSAAELTGAQLAAGGGVQGGGCGGRESQCAAALQLRQL
jgi:hypothetical protein